MTRTGGGVIFVIWVRTYHVAAASSSTWHIFESPPSDASTIGSCEDNPVQELEVYPGSLLRAGVERLSSNLTMLRRDSLQR